MTPSKINFITLRYRLDRWLALFPVRRSLALAFLIAGGAAALVSGLLALDHWMRAALDFIIAIFFLGIGTALWNME